MSLLTEAFEKAFCTEKLEPGKSVTCNCGTTYSADTENHFHYGEGPGGVIVVAGCGCPYAESFGGTLWRYRHQVAGYLRNMLATQDAESRRLRGELPTELGNLEGKCGTLAGGMSCRVLEDHGNRLLVLTYGIGGGKELVMRSAFTEDK